MTLNEIREKFLSFFEGKGHTRVASSPLIPSNDPTLLFTNAGMVQFKETFLGDDPRPYTRATTAQRCVRAGGKHNDLENVGYTARHHTFFEMMGNFSFGDYFKEEAIRYAWEFVTEVLKLPPEKLWVTVYKDDQESEDIWLKTMKHDPKRFSRCGEKDNFWSMGDTGPCGPCTEIFYDHGPEIAGGPPGSPEEDGDRYIEIWNLVFMQYNRTKDGQLHDLPKPSVDTGMGLERVAAVVQGVHNNYDIDLFKALTASAAKATGVKEEGQKSLRVIADHIRACSFLICDGVRPSNEGRGYVLRRIIRRAIRHGHQLGTHEIFFYRLVDTLVKEMGDAYPELVEHQKTIIQVLKQEEEQFVRTLDLGLKVLEQELASMKTKEIPGDVVFKLYDTYGFPVDLTNDIAREKGLTLDIAGFEANMQNQRERSQGAAKFEVDYNQKLDVKTQTKFTGYETLQDEGKIEAIFVEGQPKQTLNEGERGIVVLNQTSFYAQSGGQVGDIGALTTDKASFEVKDTTKQQKTHLHHGIMQNGSLSVGDNVKTCVDEATRNATVLNHSATHLLHAALRKILGTHVVQKGSLVAPDRLRFDFAHTASLTRDEVKAIEQLVNDVIRQDAESHVEVMSSDKAMKSGALALFGEKYDDNVRVLDMGDGFSKELCGGTHVDRAGKVGFFKIIQETGIAAGVRRIEALTGQGALDYAQHLEDDLGDVAALLKTQPDAVTEKVKLLLEKSREQERQIQALNRKLMTGGAGNTTDVQTIGDVKVLAMQVEVHDAKALREAVDQWKSKFDKGVVVLAAVEDDKVSLIAGVTKNCADVLSAGELMRYLTEQMGGKGGGRPDMAQGGGPLTDKLGAILASTSDWVKEKIG